jgi:hypothetical protein
MKIEEQNSEFMTSIFVRNLCRAGLLLKRAHLLFKHCVRSGHLDY